MVNPTRAFWGCTAALAALTAALAATFTSGGTLGSVGPLRGWYLADVLLFALAVLLLRRCPPRWTATLVVAGSLAVALTGLLAPPRTSDDAYRYVWDGQVQSAGISPYSYAPTDPALAALRPDAPGLFPVHGSCVGWDLRVSTVGCTHINRPTVHTIYPPVAEVWFLGMYEAGRLTGDHGVRIAQAGGALLAVLTTGALLLVLRRIRAPLHRAALWGWCPGVAFWAVSDAHVDTLGALLTVCGTGVLCRGGAAGRRRAAAGGVLGAAAATKLIPVLVLPGALSGALARGRRIGPRDLIVPAAALAAFLLCYLPYVLVSGLGVIGYLPGYLQEEGYDQGTRFGLLTLLDLPPALLPLVVAGVLLGAVLVVLRYGDPDAPWRGSLLVTGTALFLAAPGYPWYALLVVALVALDGRWEWLALPVAAALMVLFGGSLQQAGYTGALCVVLTGTALRRLAATAELVVGRTTAPAAGAPAAGAPAAGAATAVSAPAVRARAAQAAAGSGPSVPTPIRTGSSR
jgi:hypothetical protein